MNPLKGESFLQLTVEEKVRDSKHANDLTHHHRSEDGRGYTAKNAKVHQKLRASKRNLSPTITRS